MADIAQQPNQAIQLLDANNLPNLQEAEEVGIDLTSEYWTPEKEGEIKLGFLIGVEDSTYVDESSGVSTELPCVHFLEQLKDGSTRVVRNGSKRLVGTIEDAVRSNKIQQSTPIKIEYLGKVKNKNNSRMSDNWSVKPLVVKSNG
jgi:hypothetical protein